jgi:hypothetical protein
LSFGAPLVAPAIACGVTHGFQQPGTCRAGEYLLCFSGVIYFSQCDEMKAAISQGIPIL